MEETRPPMSDDPNQGIDFDADDPLPDVPSAGDDSVPITSPNPIDFSTKGISGAGAAGMSTFNDDDDRSLFERTATAFEEGDIDSPMLGDTDSPMPGDSDEAGPQRRAQTYE